MVMNLKSPNNKSILLKFDHGVGGSGVNLLGFWKSLTLGSLSVICPGE